MIKTIIVLLIFYTLSLLLFTYKLTVVPPGINGDEAAIGYSASLISKTGYDSKGKFLPLFTTVSWPDWKQPITLYSTVLIFKLFGTSYFNLRMMSVLFVLLSGTIILFLTREIFNKKFAILSLYIFATIPIITIQSHLALENIAPVPFISFWLWMMAKYSKAKKVKYLIFSALALGMSLYSYLGLRLIVPILVILSVAYIFYLNKSKRANLYPIIIFFITLIPFLLLLLVVKNEYPAAVFASNRPLNITAYQQFLLPYISSYDLSFLFMKGDLTPYHSTGKQGMFLIATLPLFILGLFKIARERKPFFMFVLLVFFFSPILYGLPGSIYRASRLLSILPSFVIITLLGFESLYEIRKRIFRFTAILLIVVLIFLNYTDFVSDYWFSYPNRVNQNFEKPVNIVYGKIKKLSKSENLTVYLHSGIPERNPMAYLFFEDEYFPNGLKRWHEEQEIPSKSIVIMPAQIYREIGSPKNVEVIDNGSVDLMLVINK